MTSQILAIFYLNSLDHFIKEKLQIKYYIRYMDDLILFHEDKSYLRFCLSEIEKELKKLKLSLNNKTNIFKLEKNFNFLGYRFAIKNNKIYMLISNDMKKKIRKRYKKQGNIIIKNYNGYLKRCSSNYYVYGLKIRKNIKV